MNLTLKEITDKIQSYPPDTQFQIPGDVYNYGTSQVLSNVAVLRLNGLYKHWEDKHDTKFFISEEKDNCGIWDARALKYNYCKLVKIGMTNDSLEQSNLNLNTPQE